MVFAAGLSERFTFGGNAPYSMEARPPQHFISWRWGGFLLQFPIGAHLPPMGRPRLVQGRMPRLGAGELCAARNVRSAWRSVRPVHILTGLSAKVAPFGDLHLS